VAVVGNAAGVRERLRITFSSAQRLARASTAATVLGGWDTTLRAGLGSRGPGPSRPASVLRAENFGRMELASWRLRRLWEGEEGERSDKIAARGFGWARVAGDARVGRVGCSWSEMSVAAAASPGGDEERTGVVLRRTPGRDGGGFVRLIRADVGRRICRARLCRGRGRAPISTSTPGTCGFHLRDSTEGYLCPVYLQPFLERSRCEMEYVTEKKQPAQRRSTYKARPSDPSYARAWLVRHEAWHLARSSRTWP
jgi:hypothetical protein